MFPKERRGEERCSPRRGEERRDVPRGEVLSEERCYPRRDVPRGEMFPEERCHPVVRDGRCTACSAIGQGKKLKLFAVQSQPHILGAKKSYKNQKRDLRSQ